MTWILEGAALFCVVYYVILTVYAGFSVSFSLIWPALATVFVLLAAGLHFLRRHEGRAPSWIFISTATVCMAGFVIFAVTEALIAFHAFTATRQAADYVIVLGARVKDREISRSLKRRLDRAVEYAEANPNTVLVLSGGQGKDEPVSEARAMYEYLEYNGVAPERLLLEDQSSNTAQNITFSRKVIERQEFYKAQSAQARLQEYYQERSQEDPVRIAVLTSDYHLFRAKSIARKQGLSGVTGIAASGDPVLAIHMWVRECFAVLKDKFMGRM